MSCSKSKEVPPAPHPKQRSSTQSHNRSRRKGNVNSNSGVLLGEVPTDREIFLDVNGSLFWDISIWETYISSWQEPNYNMWFRIQREFIDMCLLKEGLNPTQISRLATRSLITHANDDDRPLKGHGGNLKIDPSPFEGS